MDTIHDLEAKRESILTEMRSIRTLRRGNISEQFLKVRHQGVREPVLRGPYYVWLRRDGKKVISQRVTSGSELERMRRDIEAHRRFVALCREFESLTEQLGDIEQESPAMGQEKKRRRLPSSKRQK